MPALWELWGPPLDPPNAGGLPRQAAVEIAACYWHQDPHLAAALMWEAYAAMLPMEPAVRSVSTGAQSVTYDTGWTGRALAKAAWHRSMAGNLATVEVELAPPMGLHDGGLEWPWPDWIEAEPL